jgi:hypothetical protein
MAGDRPQSDQEGGLERICAIIALFFWSLVLIEGLGITIIVGVSDISPRDAALMMLFPALLVWVLASSRRSIRQAALMLFPPFA